MKRNWTAAIPLLAIYIGSVVAANWLTTRYGLISIGFGLYATAGTIAVGGAIMTRDFLQDGDPPCCTSPTRQANWRVTP